MCATPSYTPEPVVHRRTDSRYWSRGVCIVSSRRARVKSFQIGSLIATRLQRKLEDAAAGVPPRRCPSAKGAWFDRCEHEQRFDRGAAPGSGCAASNTALNSAVRKVGLNADDPFFPRAMRRPEFASQVNEMDDRRPRVQRGRRTLDKKEARTVDPKFIRHVQNICWFVHVSCHGTTKLPATSPKVTCPQFFRAKYI